MGCIAESAEGDDVRYEFRIEVRERFLTTYQRHLRARADTFNAQYPSLRLYIVWMHVECLAEFRSTVSEHYRAVGRSAIVAAARRATKPTSAVRSPCSMTPPSSSTP